MFKAHRIAAFFAALFVIFSLAFSGTHTAYAAISHTLNYERSDVLNDLKASSIDGKPFDVADYPFTNEKETQIISFAEYCYAYNTNARVNYGLYAYVYNPQHINFDFDSSSNKIQFAYGSDAASGYANYALRLLSVTRDGKFAKYKVAMTDGQRSEILSGLDVSSRVYSVSGVTLRTAGERLPEEYTVSTTFTYTGYAEGYGAYPEAQSTLTCTRQELETAKLEVEGTYYRYSRTSTTATQLNSVYFAVDNRLLKKYGTIYRIWAEYWQYELAPIAVVKSSGLYNSLNDAPATLEGSFDWLLAAYSRAVTGGTQTHYYCDWAYGTSPWINFGSSTRLEQNEGFINYKNKLLAFQSDAPRSAFISREELLKKMYEVAEQTGAAHNELNDVVLPGGKGYTPIDLTADDLFDIKGFTTGSGFLDWFYGLFSSNTEDLKGIEPIYQVKDADLKRDDVCNNLLIATEDEQAFIDYCTEAELNDKTVFLFRYGTSEYKELRALSIPSGATAFWEENDTDSIRFQTIDRNFDIIQLGFGNAKQLVIIPVVASPIDNLAGSSGISQIMKDTNRGGKGLPWWVILIIVVVAVLLILLIITPKRRSQATAPAASRTSKRRSKSKRAKTKKKRQ